MIIDHATTVHYDGLACTVPEGNSPSLNVLGKLGFADTVELEVDAAHGDSLVLL